jgi:apolipoprotein D and lipocalin family protein
MSGVKRLWIFTLFAGCAASQPMPTVDFVNLERFMGDWYVLANIPTGIEEGAHNAVESYRMAGDGKIETTFTFLEGGFDGERKTYNPTGFIRDRNTNAEWGMQFFWPIKADYRIVYLDDDYEVTIIGREKRDYVWIMARVPEIDPERYEALLDRVAELGYDRSQVQRVPQRWP